MLSSPTSNQNKNNNHHHTTTNNQLLTPTNSPPKLDQLELTPTTELIHQLSSLTLNSAQSSKVLTSSKEEEERDHDELRDNNHSLQLNQSGIDVRDEDNE